MAEQESKYWLDVAVNSIITSFPDKSQQIVLSSGISPSASYHIGHFREILTVDAMAWALQQAGRKVRHLHIVDDFDPLRKRYDFLPAAFDKYVGWPVCLVPDPEGDCHQSYADHFYSEFEKHIQIIGVEAEIIRSYSDLYLAGKMTTRFEEVLENIESVHKTLKEVSNRDLDKDWTPIQVLGEDNRFFNARLSSWDQKAKTIEGKSYADGHAKLNWRLDWPARWATLGVMVEPHGRELASAGSAWDTGKRFAKEIFKVSPPLPTGSYETINLVGQTKKMSSSLGNIVTPKEALEIMPAEVLRYFVVRSRPEKKLYFDPGEGLYSLLDEFSQIADTPQHEFKDAYNFATETSGAGRIISTVPFKHLVSVHQASLKDPEKVLEILKRTGYEKQVTGQREIILDELKYIDNWLNKYAPKEVKFEVQKKIPEVGLSDEQKRFLGELSDSLAELPQLEAKTVHETIYKLKDEHKLEPAGAFKAIYRVILGKDYGPKAGWFLASLDKNWLVKRLKLEA